MAQQLRANRQDRIRRAASELLRMVQSEAEATASLTRSPLWYSRTCSALLRMPVGCLRRAWGRLFLASQPLCRVAGCDCRYAPAMALSGGRGRFVTAGRYETR